MIEHLKFFLSQISNALRQIYFLLPSLGNNTVIQSLEKHEFPLLAPCLYQDTLLINIHCKEWAYCSTASRKAFYQTTFLKAQHLAIEEIIPKICFHNLYQNTNYKSKFVLTQTPYWLSCLHLARNYYMTQSKFVRFEIRI